MRKRDRAGNVLIITDLEGVSGVTRFDQAAAGNPEKPSAMDMLTSDVNVVIRGIRSFDPGINIHVWDGHGAGGLVQDDLLPVEGMFAGSMRDAVPYFKEKGIDALAFVGQHAMSYTVHGNLCHTMSHTGIHYYMLNGCLVGEFGFWAAVAGEAGIKTVYLAGDDKACAEAAMHVPGIVTTITKFGTGWETADCRPVAAVHDDQFKDIQTALASASSIGPFNIGKPVTFEVSVTDWIALNGHLKRGALRRGSRTAIYHAPSMADLLGRL